MERDLRPEPSGGRRGRPCREVVVVESGEYPAVAAVRVAWAIQDADDEGDVVSLALAGGSTPRPVYEELARIPNLGWDGVEIYFGDERAVPADHPESNYGMARETLLDRIPVTGDRVHRMEAGAEDLEAAARRYSRRLPDRLDLLLLGIGTDGHTASLFPGSDALGEEEREVVVVEGPDEPRIRLTVTPPVIRRAGCTIVLARGEAKAEAVAAALTGPDEPFACPATLARDGTWILDPGAASALATEEAGA